MRSFVFLLTGFPGTGKLTVANALAELLQDRGETTRIVDNHWINNPIFGLVEQDGLTPLPAAVWETGVKGAVAARPPVFLNRCWGAACQNWRFTPVSWDRVGEVAEAVVRTVEDLTPRTWHVVFTAYLDGETDTRTVPRLAEAAETRDAVFIPVRLVCDTEENARRIVAAGRRERMKSVDPDEPHRLAAMVSPTTHPTPTP